MKLGTILHKVDLKTTPAREAVLELLYEARAPLDVGAIIGYLSKTGIETDPATIFRMMNTFTEKGITRQIQLHEGKARYELASLPEHHHLVCEKCGRIEDISNCAIQPLEEEIASKKKFLVKRHSLEFFGVCRSCQS